MEDRNNVNNWYYLTIIIGGITISTMLFYFFSEAFEYLILSLVNFAILIGLMITVAKPQLQGTYEKKHEGQDSS